MLDRRAFVSGIILLAAGCRSSDRDIVVGSKNFTEQLILGEMFAQMLERSTAGSKSAGRFYLAGTYICQQAILAGRIDVYPEYTGTALAAVLKQKASGDAAQVYEEVKREYHIRFNLDVMPPLGFDNSFAMVMRGDDARHIGLTKLSQLGPVSPQLKLGVGYEFLERQDGYQGLVRTYELRFCGSPARDGPGPAVSGAAEWLGRYRRRIEHRRADRRAGTRCARGRSALLSTVRCRAYRAS